jgi:hypothetical protein
MEKNRRAIVALEERRKKTLAQLAKKVDAVSTIPCTLSCFKVMLTHERLCDSDIGT